MQGVGHRLCALLANLYMRRFVLGWKKLGLERSLGSRIVTYADDLVILCRKGKAEEALQRLREIMGKLKLTVNEEKTRSGNGATARFLGHRQTKGAATDKPDLRPPRHISTLPICVVRDDSNFVRPLQMRAAFLSGSVCEIKSELPQFGELGCTAVTQSPNHSVTQ